MKTLVIFTVVFFIAKNEAMECWLAGRRERLPLETSDILKLHESLMKFEFFQTLQERDHETFEVFHIRGGTVAENTTNVRDELLGMSRRLLALSYVYLAIHMIEYFALVGRYIEENPDWDGTEESRDLVGLRGDRGFCAVTAFYDCDCGIDADEALETVFFARSLGQDKHDYFNARIVLSERIAAYRERYENYLDYPENSHLPRVLDVVYVLNNTAQNIGEIKRALTDFSDAFCSRWRPFVPDILLPANRGVDHRKHDGMFVRHIFDKKVCEVNVKRNDSPWYCFNVLYMMDYGYLKYRDTVKKDRTFLKQVIKRDERPQRSAFMRSNVYTLGTLRDVFRDEFVGYKNAVNYDDMASTAMLFFAIREGGKILKGIKRAIECYCAGTVDEETGIVYYRISGEAHAVMRDLRSTLLIFKSVLDNLVTLMWDKKRVDVSNDGELTSFSDRVQLIVKLSDVQDGPRTDGWKEVQKMCSGVLYSLRGRMFDASSGDNEYTFSKADRFTEFFITTPLLNVNQLYRFYAYEYL